MLIALKDHPLLQPRGDLDTSVYIALAKQLPAKAFFVSPLYLYFLRALGVSLRAARIVQIVLGSLAVVLIFDTARRWFDDRAATIGAILAILTGVISFYEVTILQAALDPLLVALTLWALTLALQSGSLRMFALTGAALGLLVLNRPNALLWVPLLAAGVLRLRGWRNALVLAVAVFVPIMPVSIRNYAVSHQFVLIASHGGLNFYIGNNAAADGTYHHVPGIRPTIAGQEDDTLRVAALAMHRNSVSAEEASSYFYDQAWGWIRSNAGAAFVLFLRKIAYTFNRTDLALNYSYSFFQHDTRSPLLLLFVGPWLLFPLGLAGAAGRLRDRQFALWATFVPLYAISVAIFFVSSRYRLPLLIPMCITAGSMFVRPRLWTWIVAVVIAIAVCWNLGLDDGRAHERTNMVVYLIENHRFDDAAQWVAATGAMTRDPATLYIRSALAYGAAGAPERELPMIQQLEAVPHAPEEGSEAAQMARELGAGFVKSERPELALAAFGAAHQLEPGDASDLLNIAVLQAQAGNINAARENARAALRLRPAYPQAEGLLRALEGP